MDLLELFASLALDTSEYDAGLKGAADKASSFGEALKSGLSAAANVGVAALSAAATGISALVKSSVESYADYEQLVGGVETLFKGSADKVMQYANDAYKTAGLSANEYMETVTSFSASLLQSLGGDTAKAADLANQAIVDMADNSNKMGTSMSTIQKAYDGFARGSFRMLSSLKLGYSGTKSEMERLLDDATKLSGIKYDISNYADIISAIHVIQTEMGITGTTAKEASETISGSLSAMKSAWQNLVTGIADENADFDTLINNFVDSAVTAGDNLIPRIEQALVGVGKLVEGIAPVIADKLPGLVSELLPPLLSAAASLLDAVVQSLPTIIQTLVDALPGLVTMLLETIADMSPELVELGVLLVVALIDGISSATPTLLEKIPEIVASLAVALVQNAPKILEAGIKLIGALAQGIINGIGAGIAATEQIVNAIRDVFTNLKESALNWGKDLVTNFIDGIKSMWDRAKGAVSSFAGMIKDFLGFSEPKYGPLSRFHEFAPDMVALFAQGIRESEHVVTDQIKESFNFSPAIKANAASNSMSATQEYTIPRYSGNSYSAKPVQIDLILDNTVIGRALLPYIEAEQTRVGVRLASI